MNVIALPEHCKITGDLDSEPPIVDRLKLLHIIEIVRRDGVPAVHGHHEHALCVHESQLGTVGDSGQVFPLFAAVCI
ncbi:MAG TPA: hypothetical protein VK463_06115 [Desulfomonilaceae bacterium]|nr:hypothetical protein [Desulfomonilaceae bacterium]